MSAAADPAPRADVPDVVAPPPGHPRFPLMDGLRAIAALGVLVSHAAYLSGASQDAVYGPFVANGAAGVTVFFVLSGFLLYRPFVAADLDGAPRVAVADYARRRVLRIFPAYWLALTVLAVVPGLSGVFTGDWWKFYGLLQVYFADATAHGLVAAWSLCIEVSFYAYLPLHAVLMRRAGRRLGRPARIRLECAVLAALAVLSVGLRAASLASGGSILELTLAGTFAWFALGMGMAVLSVGPAPSRAAALARAHPGACWLAAGALFVAMALVLRAPEGEPLQYTQRQWLIQHVLAGAVAAALVLPAVAGHRGGGLPRRVLAWGPLAWLGLISYGIFLWQGGWVAWLYEQGAREWLPGGPFVGLAGLTFIGSVACAALSYYALERPLMRWKRPARRAPGPRGTAAGAASARAPAPRSGRGSPR